MESEERRGKSRQLRVESEGNEGGAGGSDPAQAATEEGSQFTRHHPQPPRRNSASMNNRPFQKDIEQKYIFIAPQQNVILDWLNYCCIRDPKFPLAFISSIYFDTPTLDLYREKRNGDYLKCKVRLRWYTDLQDSAPDSQIKCYLEIKRKYGSIRQKDRIELTMPSRSLHHNTFSDDAIVSLPSRVYDLLYFPRSILVPTLLIQYTRYRFLDPHTHSRIALDTDICCPSANSAYFPALLPVHLGIAVLEIKGQHTQLLPCFNPIADYLTKEPFSKYAHCCERLLQPLGRRL